MPQRCTHAPSGTPVVILRGGRRPRIRQSSRQFLSACCVSGGSDELHFPMLLSNGNDVKSRQSWRVRVKMAEYLASIFGTEKDKSGPAGTGTNAPGFTTNRLSASFGVRRMQSVQWLSSITAGSTGRLCMLSCLLSPTFGSHAAGSMRWGNVPVVASATSCTCGPSPLTSDVSCMGGDPGAGHPRGPTPATVPEKETDDIPQTTGMDTSETLAPLTSTPDRLKSSQPAPLLKAPLIPQCHLPQAPGLHDVSVQHRDLLLPPLP
ncbi:splicing factor U2AF 26 kDa subunit isoform X2 [Meles meles]|uniref:splicing factor U2AF 26 kDa subunit isoform X2 n=1 Tax=Meles meles TaxID=9662 RepID=UPI001E6A001E|nr:splicing factor U2AF 26 kDa subunit isoform X2 [Meles meles]